MTNYGITALGTYLPENMLHNNDLEHHLETSDEWIRSRTGITKRFLAADHETTSTMAIRAVDNLVLRHGAGALANVDLVVVATATPDAFFPSTAALVQGHFKLQAAGFDLSAACAGWVYALQVAVAQLRAGSSKKALVIGAETFSKIVNWKDRNTAVLFGDGAGAAVLEAVDDTQGFFGFVWGADGSGGKFLNVGATASHLPDGAPLLRHVVQQQGREVFKFATRIVPESVQGVLAQAGWRIEDVARIVPHQANARIIQAASERLGCEPDKFVVSIQEHANNSAATIPLALEYGVRKGLIGRGDKLVLAGFGGGLSWAAAALVWSI